MIHFAMADIPPVYAFIQDRLKNPGPQTGGDIYEYRFLLSGCVFNADLEGDYTKSALGGLLLEEPFPLWKVGQSYDDYPQELAAWIKVAPVTHKSENMTATGTPHEVVADDLAALLTLFFRRLVVAIGPASVTLPHPYDRPPVRSPLPQPLALAAKEAYAWPRLPLTVIYGGGAPTFRNPNPQEVGVSPFALRAFFVMLAKHQYGGQIIAAARLYHRALESLFKHTDVSYLLLVWGDLKGSGLTIHLGRAVVAAQSGRKAPPTVSRRSDGVSNGLSGKPNRSRRSVPTRNSSDRLL